MPQPRQLGVDGRHLGRADRLEGAVFYGLKRSGAGRLQTAGENGVRL